MVKTTTITDMTLEEYIAANPFKRTEEELAITAERYKEAVATNKGFAVYNDNFTEIVRIIKNDRLLTEYQTKDTSYLIGD